MNKDTYLLAAIGVFATIGAMKVASTTLSMLGSFKRHYLRGTYDIYKRYNKGDSWVVVTGGSDGIGLEICH